MSTLPIHNIPRDAPREPAHGEHEPAGAEGHKWLLAEEDLPITPEEVGPFETGNKAPYEDFPDDVYRVPVPNVCFDNVSELSGPATKLLFLLAGVAYRYESDAEKWSTSPRAWTVGNLRNAYGPLSVKGASLARAAEELEDRGWISTTQKGRALGMRLLIGVEGSEGFTWTPYPYLRMLHRLTPAAAKVLLLVVRSTWGWTRREYRDGERAHSHQERAKLTNDQLSAFTGLSVRACQSAAHELEAKGMAHRSRPHRGSAFFYELTTEDVAEKASDLFITSPPTLVQSSVHGKSARPRAREADHPENASDEKTSHHVKRGERGNKSSGSRTVQEISAAFSDYEREIFSTLTSEAGEFALRATFAARQVEKWSEDVLARTMRAYQQNRRAGDLHTPAGWIYRALEQGYFARRSERVPDAQDVYRDRMAARKSGGEKSELLARMFEKKLGKEEGWEWHDQDSGESSTQESFTQESSTQESSTGGHTGRAESPGGVGDESAGITHSEMLEVIDALRQPPGSWNCTQRQGAPNLFTPDRKLARWAWAHEDDGGERARRAAELVLDVWEEVSEWDRD